MLKSIAVFSRCIFQFKMDFHFKMMKIYYFFAPNDKEFVEKGGK